VQWHELDRHRLMADTDAEIIAEAKARWERCEAWESTALEHALMDTRFANADAYNMAQWPANMIQARGDKPCLITNKTRQHNLHIVNDARQHKAAVKVTPTGQEATFEAAEVFSAAIRRIEYQSKAIDAYSTAIYHQVESGIGYVRVCTDYAETDVQKILSGPPEDFDRQEIFIRRVKDPRCIRLDPDAEEYDKSDMKFAFWFDKMPRKEFEAKYPDYKSETGATLDYKDDTFDSKDHVMVSEYWRCGQKLGKLHLLDNRTVVRDGEIPPGAKIIKSRDISEPEIEWFQLAGNQIIDRKPWPGKYIPLVPFIGEEIVIDGVMDRKGHTRALIHPQQMLNYWISEATAQVAMQTKAPYIADARAIEGQDHWHTANTENVSVLVYNGMDDAGQPIEAPKREQPPTMAQAYLEGIKIARQDMMEVSGQYQAEMGAPGNERSGTAIQQRQREGDTATYHYIDNQAKGIRQIGRICLDLIPKIYDVARVIKIMAEDGSQSDVHLDPNAPTAHQHMMPGQAGQPPVPVTPEQADAAQQDPKQPDPMLIFNPQIGAYDVEADVGPSYGTQREEAANAFTQIMSANKEAFAIVGDFWAQNSDFPGADELAERLKRGLPPQYKPGPDPQMLQLQQQLQQVTQHGQTIAKQADAEVSHLQAQIVLLKEQAKDKSGKTDNETYDAETRRLVAVANADPAAAKVIYRTMLSQLIGAPALPIMQLHDEADAEHAQSIAPPDADPAQVNGAA
jgi:hypothetical protein